MENKISTYLKVFIPAFNVYPFEKAMEWAEKYYASIKNFKRRWQRAVPDEKSFRKKVAKPLIKVTEEMISPEFRSRSGLAPENIISRLKYELRRDITARKYLEGIKRAYRTVKGVPAKKVKDILNLGAMNYWQDMTFGGWRFTGPLHGQGRGPFALTEQWLTGNPKSGHFLRKQDEVLLGKPTLISTPKKQGQFREKLHNQLMRSMSFIIDSRYDYQAINEENDKVNQLVNKYISKGFVPFNNAGESHLDFVLRPESIIPDDSPEVKQIMYDAYVYFLGKEMADYLKARWIITPRAVKPDPAEYLKSGKKAHFDMFLDIQVAQK